MSKSRAGGIFQLDFEADDLSSMLAAFEPEQTILHYRIIEPIGEGGMGEVYKATDLKLRRNVAIKVLPLSLANDKRARKRLLREARSVSALNHPNIVAVYSIEESEGHHFIVMEYVEGRTLDFLVERKSLGFLQLLNLGAQIADALSAAHKAGFIHRDIKPANILVSASGQAKLLDFGIAKRVIAPSFPADQVSSTSSNISLSGSMLGTAYYMSPEQIRARDLDERTDIFSLGVVLYECAAGRNPFFAPTLPQIVEAIHSRNPVPPSRVNEKIPPEFDKIISRALQKDKTQRYRHISQLADALRDLSAQLLNRDGAAPHPSVEEDNQQALNEEPISARQASFAYRALTKAKKNKWVSALSATLRRFMS